MPTLSEVLDARQEANKTPEIYEVWFSEVWFSSEFKNDHGAAISQDRRIATRYRSELKPNLTEGLEIGDSREISEKSYVIRVA